MSLEEETLEKVAQNGEMDYEKWPALLEPLLERLNHIVYYEFPMPRPFPIVNQPLQPPPLSEPLPNAAEPSHSTPTTQANGAQVPVTPVRTLPPVPPFNSSSTSTSHIPDSAPPSQSLPTSFTQIPALLQQLLASIQSTLRSAFASKPPHTIQRLAELVLFPTKHYKTLPAWLRAVDRVVAVSSTADIFPLPHAQPLPNSVIDSSLINGVNCDGLSTGTGSGGGGILWDNRNGVDASLGSDESLGGALLTPIPWLKNGMHNSNETSTSEESSGGDSDMLGEPIEGTSMVLEREDGAVTQGELIRQEQEAGVVPVSSSVVGTSRMMPGAEETSGDAVMDEDEEQALPPHARGPDVVGTVDMGLVKDGRGVEIQIGTHKERGQEFEGGAQDVNPHDAQDVLIHGKSAEGEGDANQQMQANTVTASLSAPSELTEKTGDGDIVLTDVDGKREGQDEQKADSTGPYGGPDASDTTTV